ncbi:MAG: choline ABC transporter permease subunit [Pseudomonadota bacterium]
MELLGWLTGDSDFKIPIGYWANAVFVWMKTHLSAVFNVIADVLEGLINGFLWLLQAPPPIFIIAIFVALAWLLQRNWKISVGVGLGFLFVVNQGYWKETTESLTLILSSCAVCMAIGVPIGIACAHNARLNAALSPIMDLMQTLPTFVYLIPAIIFFGIGMVPGLIATVIFVLPAPIRLTELGVASTPTALLEAATAFGATPSQRLIKVELPWALPQIMVGLNQTIMLSLSMVVIASMVGANGLGVPVMRALASVNAAKGFESGFVIVVVAIALRATFQRKV